MGDNIEHEKLRRRVKKLDSLRLIEKVSKEDIRKERELMHNAQANRGRAFLYPYLEKQTFLDIKGLVTTEEIFRYLYKCCDITNKIVDSLKKFKDERQWTMPLFDWNGIPGQHDKATIIFLDNEFHLNHTEYIKVEKIDEGQTFRIVDDKNDVTLIKLNKDKDRAFLVCSDQRQYELGVERSAGKLTICIPTGTPNESLLERFAEEIQHNLISLVFSLVIRLTDLDVIKEIEISDHDWKVLLPDPKFLRLIEETNKSYQEKITQIMNLK